MRKLIEFVWDILYSIAIGIFVMAIPVMVLVTLLLGGVYTLWILTIVGVLSILYLLGSGLRP